jgi:hypothetical protein
MKILLDILFVYLLGVALIHLRLHWILRRIVRQLVDEGLSNKIESKKYFWVTLTDSMKWPYYLVWHGLKSLIGDLK